jgi:hypothetical protein
MPRFISDSFPTPPCRSSATAESVDFQRSSARPAKLAEIIGDYDGLAIRSATR